MAATEAHLTDAYGIDLHYRRWDAKNPVAVVQLVHGVGEHIGRYEHVAAFLNQHGFTVYGDDHRGHGKTGILQHAGHPERLGRLGPGGHPAAVDGVNLMVEHIQAEHPELPHFVIGHSWGSFITQILLNQGRLDNVAGVVLSGSSYRMPGYLNAGDLNKPWRGPDSTGLEWLSRDPAVWQAFQDDPLTTSEPLMKLFGVVDATRLFGRPKRGIDPELPMLLIVGSEDTVGGARSVRRLERAYRERAGITDIRTIVYEGARHEPFNETNKDEVLQDVLAWLQEHLPSA